MNIPIIIEVENVGTIDFGEVPVKDLPGVIEWLYRVQLINSDGELFYMKGHIIDIGLRNEEAHISVAYAELDNG